MTLALLSQQQRHYAKVLPRLVRRHREDKTGPELPARIALSDSLAVHFMVGRDPISNRVLRSLPGSMLVWWNTSAANVLQSARNSKEPLVRLEQAAGGGGLWRLSTAGGVNPADWLAHPRTFGALRAAVAEHTDQPVLFFTPSSQEVFVATQSAAGMLMGMGAHLPQEQWLTPAPVRFHHGYPVVLGRDRPPLGSAPHPRLLERAPALTAA